MANRQGASLRASYPNVEVEILIRDGLNVEADGRDGGDNLTDLDKTPVSTLYTNPRPRVYHTFSLYNNVVLPALSYNLDALASTAEQSGNKTSSYQTQDQYSDLLLRP